MQECRNESEIYNYQRVQLSNNKFINGILRVRMTWFDCKRSFIINYCLTVFCYINFIYTNYVYDANLCQASFASFTPTGKTLNGKKRKRKKRKKLERSLYTKKPGWTSYFLNCSGSDSWSFWTLQINIFLSGSSVVLRNSWPSLSLSWRKCKRNSKINNTKRENTHKCNAIKKQLHLKLY